VGAGNINSSLAEYVFFVDDDAIKIGLDAPGRIKHFPDASVISPDRGEVSSPSLPDEIQFEEGRCARVHRIAIASPFSLTLDSARYRSIRCIAASEIARSIQGRVSILLATWRQLPDRCLAKSWAESRIRGPASPSLAIFRPPDFKLSDTNNSLGQQRQAHSSTRRRRRRRRRRGRIAQGPAAAIPGDVI